jgi:hypothetical protein
VRRCSRVGAGGVFAAYRDPCGVEPVDVPERQSLALGEVEQRHGHEFADDDIVDGRSDR